MFRFTSVHRSFAIAVGAFMLVAAVTAGTALGAKKPPPPPAPPPPSTTSTFIKNYANIVAGVETSVTPEDVQPTPDGGTIGLSLVQSPQGVGVNWLTKLDPTGAIQWQEEVGCLSTAPGDYSNGVSLAPTKDGGYLIGGSTIGCGSAATCPVSSGLTCGFAEKVGSTGAVIFAQAYLLGADGATFNAVRPTGDGGFIAAGSSTDASNTTSGLIAKLDASGNLVWDSTYQPSGTFQAADFESA